ncbi:LysR family transcriptional regulator [Hyphococcus sp.]|jgi:DNA-binding transcriptional LysR family regulator|uniref:LysR family transcriptional regulator n=1 Tax=Hyphococcus sp. TaxID=2038636 RepID=UPI0035C68E24
MLDLNLLRTFVAVADRRRISQAAELLGLPKSTVSRHIAKLEDDFGSRLFKRDSDGFELTPTGQRLYSRTRNAVHELSEDVFGLAVAERRGIIKIQAPSVYGRGILKNLVRDYLLSRPQCAVDVTLTDRFAAPDLTQVDLGFFVGMSPGRQVDLWPLGFVEAKLYGAPSLFTDCDPPSNPADLKNWPAVTNECGPGAQGRITLQKNGDTSVALGPIRLSTGDPELLLEAAIAGIGIARLPTFFASSALAEGRLITVLPDYNADRHAVNIARCQRNTNPAATDFAEFVTERVKRLSNDND